MSVTKTALIFGKTIISVATLSLCILPTTVTNARDHG